MAEYETIRSLAESVTEPFMVWTDEPLDLVHRVFWSYDPRNLQISIRWLDAERMRSPGALWDEFCAALQFPHFFGRNWNAFIDCLRALDWELRRSHVLIVVNAESLLADDRPDGLEHFRHVLGFVADELSREYQESFDRRRPPTPFHVVFHAAGAGADRWQERLNTGGLVVPKMPLRNPASWP